MHDTLRSKLPGPLARRSADDSTSDVGRESLIVRPHSQDLHNSLLVEDLVDETMLDADSPGVRPGEIANELLETGRRPARVAPDDREEFFGLGSQTRASKLLGILLRLPCEDNLPVHASRRSKHSSTGVASPSRIDSRIPGTDSK